jgi:hypothetical protein
MALREIGYFFLVVRYFELQLLVVSYIYEAPCKVKGPRNIMACKPNK